MYQLVFMSFGHGLCEKKVIDYKKTKTKPKKKELCKYCMMEYDDPREENNISIIWTFH